MSLRYLHLILMFFVATNCVGQSNDSLVRNVEKIPAKYYSAIYKKYCSIDNRLSRKSIKYLRNLQKQEDRITRRLALMDSGIAKGSELISKKYNSLVEEFKEKKAKVPHVNLNDYNSYIDTLSTSLSFLKGLADNGKAALPLEKLDELKDKFNETARVNQFISERKEQIQQLLSKYTQLPGSLKRQFDNMEKTAYYYKAQVNEYKSMLKDPKKIEETAISVLNSIPAFQKFMKENSQLASLFGLPEGYRTPAGLSGLQSRASVQALIQQKITAGGPNAMAQIKQNLGEAQDQLSKLKDKLNKLGGGGNGDLDLPDFKPNNQKTKPFLSRLEYGCNVQFGKTNRWVPSAANLGMSLGYKINDRSSAGIGMSYSAGLGTLQHIEITSQGLGLRSYLEWKIKKQFYASGGYEMNYYSAFKKIEELKNKSTWQRNALLGLSKKYQIAKKVKGNLQLLYDFLAYKHSPVSQPFLFRIGYNF